MKFLSKYSIKYQIIFIVLLINLLTISAITIVVTMNNIKNYKSDLEAAIKVEASLIEEYCITTLVFEDKKGTNQLLLKLKNLPDIVNIRIFDKQNEIFASYDKTSQIFDMPENQKKEFRLFSDNYLHFFNPIYYDKKYLGTLYIRVSLDTLNHKIGNTILFASVLILIVLFISFLLARWFQRFVTQPILSLASTTADISKNANYSVRLNDESNNEIGILYRQFNNMLEQIEARQVERDKAQEDLKESEERFKTISESAYDAIVVLDANGNVNYWNRAAQQIFGYSSDEILGVNFLARILLPVQSNEKIHYDIIQFFNTERQQVGGKHFETKSLTKDKQEIEIELSLSTTKIQDTWNVIGIIKDISARKVYENNLKKAKENAEQSDRLKTAFLANMSHEIRTPMNAIVGFTDIIRSSSITEQQRNEFLDIVQRNSNVLLRLIDNILIISEVYSGKVVISEYECTLEKVFNNVHSDLEKERQATGKHLVEVHQKLPDVHQGMKILTDEFRLTQVLTNLLDNALKFTQTGSIEYGYTINDNVLVFFVSDTGIGMSEEIKQVIFDGFRQADYGTKRKFGGIGLGLAISKSLIELLKGRIWVDSSLDKGTTFYFSIPYKPSNVVSNTKVYEKDVVIPQYDWSDKTILVVEDEDSNYKYIKEILALTKVNVLWANDGEPAVELCRTNKAIGLVLMDLQMKKMDGFDAVIKIKKINPKLPIIAQTAYNTAAEMGRCRELGFSDYITKPLGMNSLLETISRFIS